MLSEDGCRVLKDPRSIAAEAQMGDARAAVECLKQQALEGKTEEA